MHGSRAPGGKSKSSVELGKKVEKRFWGFTRLITNQSRSVVQRVYLPGNKG